MRYIHIVLFIFIFNISIALLNTSNAFPTQYEKNFDDSFINRTSDIAEQENSSSSTISQGNDYLTAVGNFARGMWLFGEVFFYATVGVQPMMVKFLGGNMWPVANTIANYVSAIIYMIYLIGAIQFISNRSFKAQE